MALTSETACPACGAANPSGHRFCGTCGAALEIECPSCGASSPAGFAFCGTCGARLSAPGSQPGSVEERKLVSVLFADLTASTELATRMDPEDLRAVLQPFFAAMAEEIDRYGGTVEKFIGDAVVAVFGAPAAHEDDPERAVHAALAMQQRLSELNPDLEESQGVLLDMRVGVNTGEALSAGDAREQHQGMVTGEVVNVAARLQAEAPPGTVVVAERTHRDTTHAFDFRPLGELHLKGIDRPVAAWQVVAHQPRLESRGVARAPMVGREAELELLRLLLGRTEREGRPNLVTLVGPAGIGKSRLSLEFLASLTGSVRVVRGRCLPYGEGLTYWPLAEILKGDAGILDSDEPETSLRKVRRLLEERLPPDAVQVVVSSIGFPVDSDPLSGTDPAVAREAISRAWRTYFQVLASGGPVVVLVEDLHWADPGLLGVLESVASRATAPLLMVATTRPELSERRPGWGTGVPNATSIELSPLTPEESRTLAAHLLGGASVPEEVLSRVLDRAEGNPFFAEELLRMLVEDGVLVQGDGGWEVQGAVPAVLPDTVQAAIAARIDRLPIAEKRAVQDAAAVGRTFWEGVVRRLGSDEASRALDGLVQKGLVRERDASSIEGERELMFHHVLTRDVAYQSIPRTRRAEAHRAAGLWIEEVTRGRGEEFAEILAHHFELAGDRERAGRYALAAGHRQRRLFAAEEAIRWYDRVLRDGAGAAEDSAVAAETTLARGEAMELLAHFTEAERDYRIVVATARDLGHGELEARALAALAHVYWLEDRFDEGRPILEEALQKARSLGREDLLPRLLYTAGTMAFGLGEWAASVAFHREAVEVAQRGGDLEGEAFARHGLCETYALWGLFDEAVVEGLRSSQILRRIGHRPMLYHNDYMVGIPLWAVGRLEEALHAQLSAVEGARELGDRRNEAAGHAAATYTALSMGDLGRALGHGDRAVELQSAVPSPRQVMTGLVFRLDALAEIGEMERIAQDVAHARSLSDAIGGRYLRPRLAAFEGWIALRRGDRQGAIRLFDRGRGESEDMPLDDMVCARVEIEAWWEAGEADRVRRAAERLCRVADGRSPVFLAWGTWGRGAALYLAERWEEALAEARAARSLAEGVVVPVVWRASALAGAASEALGSTADAATFRAEAATVLRAMAEGLDGPLRRTFGGRSDVAPLLGDG